MRGSPSWREHISLWDREAYLQRAREMALPLLSPPRLVQIEFSRAQEYNLVDYPSNLAGMEVSLPAFEPTELIFDGSDDIYASHTQVN